MALARLPKVSINVAISLDGKIAPANRHFVPFTSRRDHDLMMLLRTRHDAVMSGSRTVENGKVDLGSGGKKYQKLRLDSRLPEFHLRVIVSGSGSIDPKAYIFTRRFSPIIILTSEAAPALKIRVLKDLADDLFVSPGKTLNFTSALQWLREKWKVGTLLCEGGGEVNGALFDENLVDRVYTTIAPVIIGGRDAPTMADGRGVSKLADAIQLKSRSLEKIGQELYCCYDVRKQPR